MYHMHSVTIGVSGIVLYPFFLLLFLVGMITMCVFNILHLATCEVQIVVLYFKFGFFQMGTTDQYLILYHY